LKQHLHLAQNLTRDMASSFAAITLAHVTREYPNKPDHVLNGPADLLSQRQQHPIFYGSLDWHGCVLAYWLLCRVYRYFPDLPEAAQIRGLIDSHFTDANVAAELSYLRQPLRDTFERPYGWGWLLMLAAELAKHSTGEGKRWNATLAPLAAEFARRLHGFLAKATYPIRSGVHSNTALALQFALLYAAAVKDNDLSEAVRSKAHHWYGKDEDCQAWEPGGDDFLSPSLIEAECMRHTLSAAEFLDWLSGFLPGLAEGKPAALFRPVEVSDRTDGKIAHLDGLNLSRAWCMRSIARSLPANDQRRVILLPAAEAHLRASLAHIDDDYMGSHWLATYALLALDAG
jgi:hypothetical protein